MSPSQKRAEKIQEIVKDLKSGRKVADLRFDQLIPLVARNHSYVHWTPVEVAIRAAELFYLHSKKNVLDVGSGCGKFCTLAALTTEGTYTGVEQRPFLVQAAQKLAGELGVDRAHFVCEKMEALDWTLFDGFYLFNPFYETVTHTIWIDDTVPIGSEIFQKYVKEVQDKLAAANPGTLVITYHGFGGPLPTTYSRVHTEPSGNGYLDVWLKMK